MRSYLFFDLKIFFFTLQFVVNIHIRTLKYTIFSLTALLFHRTRMTLVLSNSPIVGPVCHFQFFT